MEGVWTIALCEDDEALRSVLARAFRAEGHSVVLARTGQEAVRGFPSATPDVTVIDVGLPDSDGRDVCLALRAAGLTTPVLFLTALDALHDKISGFQSGGDDYVTKPFELPELLVRVAALARRRAGDTATNRGLRLDPDRHGVALGERTVALTPIEYRLVGRLLSRPGEVVRRQALVAAAWPPGASVHENTLDSYIRRLREKLVSLDGPPGGIETVRGVGYVWR